MKKEVKVIESDVEAVIKDVFMRFMFAKTEMCKEHPMTDNPPLFLVAKENKPEEGREEQDESAREYQSALNLKRAYDVAMVPLIHKEEVLEAYADAVNQLPIMPISFVLLAAEAFARVDENGNPITVDKLTPDTVTELLESHSDGDLQKEFAENPFSNIREVLQVSAVDWSKSQFYMATCSYTYDDKGTPQFGEPMFTKAPLKDDEDVELHGKVAKALYGTITYLQLTLQAEKFVGLLAQKPKNESN